VNAFLFESNIPRVVFGAGALQYLVREIDAMGSTRALILSTPEQLADAERVAHLLGGRAAGIFSKATMHVPIELAKEARLEASRLGADCAVVIGGGSTIGLGKAIALESGLPILAIPTTYAGSEMTPIYGVPDNGVKQTGRDARVLQHTVIYDPELTLSLPVRMTASSGLNAIAHAAENLYAHDDSPVIGLDSGHWGGVRCTAGKPGGSRCTKRCPLRIVAMWSGAWCRLDGSASQAMPHVRRSLQPSAR
jgi:maleylacetate reductase